jgi:manganese/zinc/iron transport system substrate-binding protein
MPRLIHLLLIIFSCALICEAQINYPIKVVATTGMIADAVGRVGGDKVIVKTLIKADPHLYQASPGDMLELSRADLIFFNGLLLEGKIADVLAKYAGKRKAIAVAELLPKKRLIRTGEFAETFDPHIWMDVTLWRFVVEKIGESLIELDPGNADYYRQRAANYSGELAGLNQYVSSVIGSIPLDQRTLVTAHDAFQYFGRAYDIAVRGIQGVSTDSEAGLKDINVLVQFLVEKKVPAIFVESTVSPKNVEALIQGAKAKEHQVALGGTLYSDALGEQEANTYIGMIESNANTIARALGGSVPERGFVTLEKIRQMQQ